MPYFCRPTNSVKALEAKCFNQPHTHICTHLFNGPLSGTTWVGLYYKKHSPTHTYPPDHSHLCSLKCHLIFFPYRPGLTSMQMLLRTQLLYNLPLIVNDTSLLVSSGTNCLNLFQPIRILASTAASASPSTLSMSPK